MSDWKIEEIYKIESEVNEMAVDIDGLSYLVIFGKHENGGFCAIPQMGVSCELSSHDKFEATGYNAANLSRVIKSKAKARCIAEAIHLAACAGRQE